MPKGLLRTTKECFRKSGKVARLWKHECERVFRDRMISEADMEKYDELLAGVVKAWWRDENQEELNALPNLHSSFMTFASDETALYDSITTYDALKKVSGWGSVSYTHLTLPTKRIV